MPKPTPAQLTISILRQGELVADFKRRLTDPTLHPAVKPHVEFCLGNHQYELMRLDAELRLVYQEELLCA